jgi:acyl carrier protein
MCAPLAIGFTNRFTRSFMPTLFGDEMITADPTTAPVLRIVSISLGVSIADLKLTDSLVDLGADSLDILEIVMDIEKEFDVEIPDETAAKFRTVRDLIDFCCVN